MSDLIESETPKEWTQNDVTMAAVELFASELFQIADNDSRYHHKVQQVKQSVSHGKNVCSCEDIAECILAWWGEL